MFIASLDVSNDAPEVEIDDSNTRHKATERRNRELENQSKIGIIDKKVKTKN
jgi:hypothetical protein